MIIPVDDKLSQNDKIQDYPLNEYITEKSVAQQINGTIKHPNFMGYILTCWRYHYCAIIKPDDIWYAILCELAILIKTKPKKYQALFTNSDKKQEITVLKTDDYIIDVPTIIDILKSKININMNLFDLTFTTSTEMSRLVRQIAFCDAVSPYYSYSMAMCGIPKFDIQGISEDWNKIKSSVTNLVEYFPTCKQYFNGIFKFIDNIYDVDFLKKLISEHPCGSGSQVEIDGNIRFLYINKPKLKYEYNYSTHVSIMEYKDLDNNKDYVLYGGLFSSNIKDEWLIPEYGIIVNQKE